MDNVLWTATEEELGKASHSDLINARKGAPKDVQDKLAPYEHRAFARESVAESSTPLVSAASLTAAIPAYQTSKALGLEQSRSSPSVKQVTEGLKGVVEGVTKTPWEVAEESVKQYAIATSASEASPVNSKLPWELAEQASRQYAGFQNRDKRIDFEAYLSKTSAIESANNPKAKAKSSTAMGLWQFTEGAWEDITKRMGKTYSLEDRADPEKAKEVALYSTKMNYNRAKEELGREPTETDLYIYHFLGPYKGTAKEFLTAPKGEAAYEYVSKAAAKANKSVFFDKAGNPRTVGEVLSTYARKFNTSF